MKTLAILSLSLLFPFIAYNQSNYDILSHRVDSIFEKFNNKPGCVFGIIKNGKFVHKKGYGLANLEYGIPNTPSTVFHMASVSKQFTGFAIHLLIQDGKLSLSDDIRKYLPEMDFGDTVTIDNLIHHTSGIRDQWELLIAEGTSMDDVITQKHVLNILDAQSDLFHKPGEWNVYSNSNYTLLAEIIERVSEMSFAAFMRKRIFEPLGMYNSFFLDDNDLIIKNRAYSYRPDGKGHYKKEPLNFATVGATNLQTTLEDFAKWDRNFYTFELGGKELMNEYLTKGKARDGSELKTYASGIRVRDYKGFKILTHSGGDAGYESLYVTIPELELSLIYFSNMWLNINLWEILDWYIGIETKNKKFNKYFTKPIDSFNDYLGIYNGNHVKRIIQLDDKLLLQFRENYFDELSQISIDSFFVERTNSILCFNRNDNNEVTQLTIDGDREFKKLENKILPIEQLNEYSGTYYCVELNTIRKIKIENNLLYLEGKKATNDPLFLNADDNFFVTNADEFYLALSGIRFVRNDNGDIIGYCLSTPMAHNIYFKKIKEIKYFE
jgi:CubicO group peptidase (beta-lactamase class C family)